MLFAAIDIGSNAVRLLFSDVYEGGAPGNFKKTSLIRVPLRLGADAFVHHSISDERAGDLVKTMTAFKNLIEVMKPVDFMACATSAMREAGNGGELVERIKRITGIDIEIINGEREAEIIHSNHIAEYLDTRSSCLYIDVGGGSAEFTLVAQGRIVVSKSFDIGTIRIMQKIVRRGEWEKLREWLKELTAQYGELTAIGSGGNINTVFSLSGKKPGTPLSQKKLAKISKYLQSYTYDERVEVIGLKRDRADVIIPALEIFISVMRWGKIRYIHIPVIGLLDGIIHILYERHLKAAEEKK